MMPPDGHPEGRILRLAPGTARRRHLAALVSSLGCSVALHARADAPKTSNPSGYSDYEIETVHEVRSRFRSDLDPHPEGKLVEGVEIVPLDVIERRDPAPAFMNSLHATTRPWAVRREVLLHEGNRWQQALVEETERILREFKQFSLVLCLPLRGSAPDRVRLVVITKDVWSLKVNANVRLAGGKLEYLLLQPSDENVAGTLRTGGLVMAMNPLSLRLGGRFHAPRVTGSRVNVTGDASVILSRVTGEPEGSMGGLEVTRPLFSSLSQWAWTLSGSWRNEIDRRFISGELAYYDSPRTPWRDRIPWLHRSKQNAAYAAMTRSWGWRWKNDLTLGLEASYWNAQGPDLEGHSAEVADDFRRAVIPTNDTRVGPSVIWRTYTSDFLEVLDFEVLSLQENYRLGHEAFVRLQPSPRIFGSSRDVVGLYAGLQYTIPLGDGLARAYVQPSIERDQDGVSDASLQAAVRLVSPRTGIGRFVFDVTVLDRFRNYLNRRNVIGGDTRLRGFPTSAFQGSDFLIYNLEFRTRPIELSSVQLGMTAFLDAGDAPDGLSNLRVKSSVGLGLRALFPQIARSVLRVDWGIPITPGYAGPGIPGQVMLTLGQAFPMPGVAPRPPK